MRRSGSSGWPAPVSETGGISFEIGHSADPGDHLRQKTDLGAGEGGFPQEVRRLLFRRGLDVRTAGGDGPHLLHDLPARFQERAAGPRGTLRRMAGAGYRPLVLFQRSHERRDVLPSGISLPGEEGGLQRGSAAGHQAGVLPCGPRHFRDDHDRDVLLLRPSSDGDLDPDHLLQLRAVGLDPGADLLHDGGQCLLQGHGADRQHLASASSSACGSRPSCGIRTCSRTGRHGWSRS